MINMNSAFESKSKNMALHYIDMGRYESAVNYVKEALSDEPDDGYLHYLLGICYYHLDCYKEAEEQYGLAHKYEYDVETLSKMLGHLYTDVGRLEDAESAYLEALHLNPNNADVHASYAYLMGKSGHKQKSDLLIRKARELDPINPTVLRINHLLQLADSNKEEQIRSLERFVYHADTDASVHVQAGLHALYTDKEKQAKEHFRQAYLLDPTSQLLLNILKSLDRHTHPMLIPLTWVNRMGGPAVIWGCAIGSVLLTSALGWSKLTLWIISIYLIFVIYSWTAVGILKFKSRGRGKL